MDILKAIRERRSIRNFQKKDIPKEIVDKLIDALIWAPSAEICRQENSSL